MYVYVNEEGEIEVYAEEPDLCYLCSNIGSCPLLGALQHEVVILHYDGLNIEECGMFKKKLQSKTTKTI